jgi:hypothetical protein
MISSAGKRDKGRVLKDPFRNRNDISYIGSLAITRHTGAPKVAKILELVADFVGIHTVEQRELSDPGRDGVPSQGSGRNIEITSTARTAAADCCPRP